MGKYFDFESVLTLIDKTINPEYLNPTQEIVLREVWKGKTYSEMAYEYNYDPEYIKSVGCSLWQVLSRAFDKQINKSNFVPFMRQKLNQLIEEKDYGLQKHHTQPLSTEIKNQKVCHFTMAPDIKHFIGREEELETLKLWSEEANCRCIVVSGMVGCGKTTLVTKFAKKYQARFDYVIWFSLLDVPSLKTLLDNYLKIIYKLPNNNVELESLELSVLLSNFIDCLKKQKILLIVDGLQGILKLNKTDISQNKFEEYGKFLRSIISTNHQSLLLTTSRIKPNFLEYYSGNQVKFLALRGIKPQTGKLFLNEQRDTVLDENKSLLINTIYQGNFRLLKIIKNHLDSFIEDDPEQTLQDISLLEEVSNLLELELAYCSGLKQEILYWLSIACKAITLDELKQYIEQSQSKLEFVESINSLVERSLIIEKDRTYTLMPIMKTYLRRKLVRQALQGKNL